jgi:hypothetical protein
VRLLVEQFGADRRLVVARHISDPSAACLLIDGNHVTDLGKLSVRAFVLAEAGNAVGLHELDVVGLHGGKHRAGGAA